VLSRSVVDCVRAHHLVILVFEDVTVPDELPRDVPELPLELAEVDGETRYLIGKRGDGVLPTALVRKRTARLTLLKFAILNDCSSLRPRMRYAPARPA
jgi:hypothetical protein